MFVVKWEKLSEAISMLNDTNLLKEKISNKPSKVAINNFMKGLETIPQEKDDQLPEQVTLLYNELVTKVEDEGEVAVLDVNDELKKKKEPKKTKSVPKKKKPKVIEKTEVEEDMQEKVKIDEEEKSKEKKKEKIKEVVPHPQRKKGEKDQFGTRVHTGAHQINMLFLEGATLSDIAEKVNTTTLRVRNHIAHLKEKGYNFEITKDKEGNVSYRVLVEEK